MAINQQWLCIVLQYGWQWLLNLWCIMCHHFAIKCRDTSGIVYGCEMIIDGSILFLEAVYNRFCWTIRMTKTFRLMYTCHPTKQSLAEFLWCKNVENNITPSLSSISDGLLGVRESKDCCLSLCQYHASHRIMEQAWYSYGTHPLTKNTLTTTSL